MLSIDPRQLKRFQHELRTPLSGILGMVNFLKKDPLNVAQKKYVDHIFELALSLLKVANQIDHYHSGAGMAALNNKVKILLVEDNELVRLVHYEILLSIGCEIDVAVNAEETLDQLNNKYDLILLDIGLPDINGIDLASLIRSHPIHHATRVYALTAFTDKDTKKKCLISGIDEVLHKPIREQEFKRIINKVLVVDDG